VPCPAGAMITTVRLSASTSAASAYRLSAGATPPACIVHAQSRICIISARRFVRAVKKELPPARLAGLEHNNLMPARAATRAASNPAGPHDRITILATSERGLMMWDRESSPACPRGCGYQQGFAPLIRLRFKQ